MPWKVLHCRVVVPSPFALLAFAPFVLRVYALQAEKFFVLSRNSLCDGPGPPLFLHHSNISCATFLLLTRHPGQQETNRAGHLIFQKDNRRELFPARQYPAVFDSRRLANSRHTWAHPHAAQKTREEIGKDAAAVQNQIWATGPASSMTTWWVKSSLTVSQERHPAGDGDCMTLHAGFHPMRSTALTLLSQINQPRERLVGSS